MVRILYFPCSIPSVEVFAPYGRSQGYDYEFWVTQMLGVSGNVVALMPNGSVYYYFSDNQEFTWDMVVQESGRIKPHCP